jgi:4-amino-4-deoxy-L-arabinose transferase-like glycosyltransferase
MINNKYINILIIAVSALLFIPFIGNVHLFDWDEINFAESAREMIVTGDFLNVRVNYDFFWEKPPFFIWVQVVSMKIFGINEFAARFPNALLGIITLLILFNIGKKHFNEKFGLIWVFAYAGSVLPHFYFKSGIIDPWFNLFIFLGIYYFVIYLISEKRQTKFVIISAIFIGLGTLTKGPVALLMFLISGFVYLLINKFKMRITFWDILIYVISFLFVGGFWFILQLINGNYDILHDFVKYQISLLDSHVAGHEGFFGFHFVVILIGVFPASVFALKSFRKFSDDQKTKILRQWMMILFWAVLILFSIVRTKIIHYSSLAYFPLTFFAAYAIFKTDKEELKKSKLISGILIFIAFIFAAAVFAFQYVGLNNEKIIESGIIKDKIASANLMAETSFSGFEFLLGIFLILGIISTLYFFRESYIKKVLAIFTVSLIFINLTVLFIVPEAEKISQKAVIDFYEERAGEDTYFTTYNMKSYAYLFYGRQNERIPDRSILFKGEVDKKVYVVCKINSEESFRTNFPNFIKLYDKNGYVFWERTE